MTTRRAKKPPSAERRGTATDSLARGLRPPAGGPALALAPADYIAWLADVKARVQAAQQRASLAVNAELLALYRGIGQDILDRQASGAWGDGVLARISADLRAAFPEMSGFSPTNLKYMRMFARAWPPEAIGQQPVDQLPWGHNVLLLTRLKTRDQRLAYAHATLKHGWSRAMLDHHIDLGTVERSGKAITNFERQLPKPESDLARETLKDPYRFDFLSLGEEAKERDIESALVAHVTQFLLELGAGFAFVGRQRLLDVGGDEFFVDLLFYHLKLRRYLVIELKAAGLRPEHLGQLGFYCTVVDAQVKAPEDAPTIGLLLCKTKNALVAEYALRSSTSPIGVAEYKLVESLPKDLEAGLPSIEHIEEELGRRQAKRAPPLAPTAANKRKQRG